MDGVQNECVPTDTGCVASRLSECAGMATDRTGGGGGWAIFHCSNVRRTQQCYADSQRTLCMHLNAMLAFIGNQTWSGLTSADPH